MNQISKKLKLVLIIGTTLSVLTAILAILGKTFAYYGHYRLSIIVSTGLSVVSIIAIGILIYGIYLCTREL